MSQENKASDAGFFYGWYVMASAFAILFFTGGTRYSFGVMFKPMIAEFGWNRAQFSLALTINTILWAVVIILVGKLYDRFGPKGVILISTLFLSGGLILISLIQSLWQFYLFYGILAAIGLSGPSIPVLSSVMSKWFHKWRGLAISLAISGNCFGQFALVPAFTSLVLRYGWRTSYLVCGVVILFVITTLALFVVKGEPKEQGLRPYGSRGQEKTDEGPCGSKSEDFGLREAMGTRSFWFFLCAMFICGSGDFLITTHWIPFVTDHGMSPTTAGNMLAWYGLMSLAGVLLAGPVSDLIGNKIPIAVTFLLRVLVFLLILKSQTTASLYLFAFIFGFTYLVTGPLITTILGRLYGFSHIGLLSGFVTTVHHLGGGLWAYMGGVVFDRTGSYESIFIVSTVMAFVAFVLTLLVVEKKHSHPF